MSKWFDESITEVIHQTRGELSTDQLVRQEALSILRDILSIAPFEIALDVLKSQLVKRPKELVLCVEFFLFDIFGLKLKATKRKALVVTDNAIGQKWMTQSVLFADRALKGLLQVIKEFHNIEILRLAEVLKDLDEEFMIPSQEDIRNLLRTSRSPQLKSKALRILNEQKLSNNMIFMDMLVVLIATKRISIHETPDGTFTLTTAL